MKVLVIPDCHLKPWMFAQADAIVKKGIADKAVCLMDLADDFGVHDDAQYLETCQQPRLNRLAGYRRGLRGNP